MSRRPCLPTRASCEANLFNDLVKSLVLKWGRRDAGFHHIFLKQRPPCNSPVEIKRKTNVFSCLLFSSGCLMLGSHCCLLLLHQHRAWPGGFKSGRPKFKITGLPATMTTTVLATEFDFFQLSNSAGGVFISWITES